MLLYMLIHRVETYYMATGNKRYYYLLFIWLRGGGSVHQTKTRSECVRVKELFYLDEWKVAYGFRWMRLLRTQSN